MDVQLIPFTPPAAGAALPAAIRLGVAVSRSAAELRLHYRLQDPLGCVLLPPPAAGPARRDGLWNHTCLEAFLAVPGQEGYWEVNLSPSGDWNLYRLQGYRRDLRPEPAIAALPVLCERHATGLELTLALDLSALLPAGGPLELGLSAVLESRDGALSYWALAHTGPEADFHRRDSFLLRP